MIYEPAEDSTLLAKSVKIYSKDKSILDVGTGSGILAKTAMQNKAKSVLAIDINSDAVKELKKSGVQARQSDLFSNVTGKFDLIVCNPPYLPLDKKEDMASRLITTGGKKGDEFTVKFLKGAKSHLNKSGTILLLLSSLTPRERINKIINQFYKSKVIDKQNLFMESLEVLELKFKSA